MPPRLLATLALCSLACSVALAGLGAVSWWRCVYARYTNPAGPWTSVVRCEHGVACVVWWGSTAGGISGLGIGHRERDQTGPLGSLLRDAALGFGVHQGTIGRGTSTIATIVLVPLWPAILLTAIPAAALWWRRRKRRGARGFEVETSNA